jgi:hypothetical protein
MPTWYDARAAHNLRALDNIRSLKSCAIQSQYSASPRMLAIMAAMQTNLQTMDDLNLFYDNIFNIYSAAGEGLDNWGRVLAVPRAVADGEIYLSLNDEYYRLLLLYKAMANISSAEAETMNALLAALVDTGIAGLPQAAYVLEVAPMVIRWVFEDFLDPVQLAVFKAAGTLARGAGVGWELYAVNPALIFGFDGGGWQPFNQAPFAPDGAFITGDN